MDADYAYLMGGIRVQTGKDVVSFWQAAGSRFELPHPVVFGSVHRHPALFFPAQFPTFSGADSKYLSGPGGRVSSANQSAMILEETGHWS